MGVNKLAITFEESIVAQSKSLEDSCTTSFYVYLGFIEDKLAYVGKGTKDRYKHLFGNSQIKLVSKAQKEGSVFTVRILCDWLSSDEALYLERSAIRALRPPLNLQVF